MVVSRRYLLINAVLMAWHARTHRLAGLQGCGSARRRQQAGARLHVRIVGLFSVIAVLPAILWRVVASVTLDRGLDHWFSETHNAQIVENSVDVATAYLASMARSSESDAISAWLHGRYR